MHGRASVFDLALLSTSLCNILQANLTLRRSKDTFQLSRRAARRLI